MEKLDFFQHEKDWEEILRKWKDVFQEKNNNEIVFLGSDIIYDEEITKQLISFIFKQFNEKESKKKIQFLFLLQSRINFALETMSCIDISFYHFMKYFILEKEKNKNRNSDDVEMEVEKIGRRKNRKVEDVEVEEEEVEVEMEEEEEVEEFILIKIKNNMTT